MRTETRPLQSPLLAWLPGAVSHHPGLQKAPDSNSHGHTGRKFRNLAASQRMAVATPTVIIREWSHRMSESSKHTSTGTGTDQAAGTVPRAPTPEQVRRTTLRRDAGRPKGELLEAAIRLSRFTVGLAAAGRRAKS